MSSKAILFLNTDFLKKLDISPLHGNQAAGKVQIY